MQIHKIIQTILFTIVLTGIFVFIPNKSNFNDYIMIPIICSFVVKYILGDWDKNYTYTFSDILYFGTIIMTSITTVHIMKYIF